MNEDFDKAISSSHEVFITEELKRQCSELKEKDKIIHFLTYIDSLTKLPNKNYLIMKLKELTSTESIGCKFVLYFINIDNFVNVNTVHNHDYGDKILLLISEVLKIILPEGSILCKWHGDEYIIILRNLDQEDKAKEVAEKIIDAFNKPFEIGEKQIFITISIGINMYPDGSCKVHDIIKNAQAAMHKSKDRGKNVYSFYDKELHETIDRKNEIARHLGNAIYNNELYINHQPQYGIKTDKIIGYEALLRWNNKELGLVSPKEFIPIAEGNGLILRLGNWILREVCLQNSKWIAQGFCNVVAVNISAVQFEQTGFVKIVEDILHETKLPPQFLELEITETALIKSLEKSIKIIEELRELGVSVSLDDFGTGYSSLSYLKKLPIDNIKIDKSFIDDITICENSKSILKAIVQLAHIIKLNVIAEGIESIEQSEILKEIGCDIAQGYYYSKPVSCQEIERMLGKPFQ